MKWGQEKLDEKESQNLARLCERIQNWGGTLVLVDMPLPKWHRDCALGFKNYQEIKKPYLQKMLACSGVRYIDLSEAPGLSDDKAFLDGAHPKGYITKFWAQALRDGLMSEQQPL